MQLNVLWNNKSGANEASDNKDLLPDGVSLKVATNLSDAKHLVDWAHILVAGNPDESLLKGQNLKHVIVPYVGINQNLRESVLAKTHLKLYNSHFNDKLVAQHAIALLLACSNLIVPGNRAIKQGDWLWGKENNSVNLYGKTCLLLGYGAIAKRVEKTVRALGMNVIIVKRTMENIEDVTVFTTKDLNVALEDADVVLVSLPGTAETKGLLGKEAFDFMKTTTILINVGRGEVIDQFALYEALKNRSIFAAGVDVLWNYPESDTNIIKPSQAPLYDLDNVVMSSHRASHVDGWELLAFKDVLKTIDAIAKGKARNLVDAKRGY